MRLSREPQGLLGIYWILGGGGLPPARMYKTRALETEVRLEAAIGWAQTSGTVPGTWKLSSDGWIRALEIKVGQSHLLTYYAAGIFAGSKKRARSALKKQQEQELRKREAGGQPARGNSRGEARVIARQAGLTGC
jgi:hypothetical protein